MPPQRLPDATTTFARGSLSETGLSATALERILPPLQPSSCAGASSRHTAQAEGPRLAADYDTGLPSPSPTAFFPEPFVRVFSESMKGARTGSVAADAAAGKPDVHGTSKGGAAEEASRLAVVSNSGSLTHSCSHCMLTRENHSSTQLSTSLARMTRAIGPATTPRPLNRCCPAPPSCAQRRLWTSR